MVETQSLGIGLLFMSEFKYSSRAASSFLFLMVTPFHKGILLVFFGSSKDSLLEWSMISGFCVSVLSKVSGLFVLFASETSFVAVGFVFYKKVFSIILKAVTVYI